MMTLFSGITEDFTDLDNPKLDNIGYGCLLLGSIQFFILPRLPQKMTFPSKVVKNDSKLIISFLS